VTKKKNDDNDNNRRGVKNIKLKKICFSSVLKKNRKIKSSAGGKNTSFVEKLKPSKAQPDKKKPFFE
jgi:hypothetical protein